MAILESLTAVSSILAGLASVGGAVTTAIFFIYKHFDKKNSAKMEAFTNEIKNIVGRQDTKLDDLKEANKTNTAAINKASELVTATIIDVAKKETDTKTRVGVLEKQFDLFREFMVNFSTREIKGNKDNSGGNSNGNQN